MCQRGAAATAAAAVAVMAARCGFFLSLWILLHFNIGLSEGGCGGGGGGGGSVNGTGLLPEGEEDDFLIIGHAGGDPVSHCENTLEATESALRRGWINAVELDLSLSSDGVVFLWHDPEPFSVVAVIRR